MGWLSKIFKGSSHNVSEGQYDWRYSANSNENYPSTSQVTTVDISGDVFALSVF